MPNSGSEGNVITFGSYGTGAKPIINGADVVAGWSVYSGNVWQAAYSASTPRNVIVNGSVGTKQASTGALASQGDWYWASNVLYVYSTSSPTSVEVSIRDYGIYFNGGSPAWGGSFVTVQDLSVTGANLYGINVGGSDHTLSGATVQRCTVTNNYDVGIFSWVPTNLGGTIRILNNDASYNGKQSGLDSFGGMPGGIEILGSDATYGTLIQSNNIHHNYWGMELDQWTVNSEAAYNWIHDNTLLGLNVDN